jgi:hypothetical protein
VTRRVVLVTGDAATQPAAETSRCDHARDGGQDISRLLNHPANDHTSTGGAP